MTHHHQHGWDAAADAVAFTLDALNAWPGDHALARLAVRLASVLEDWETIDRTGRELRRAAIRCSAQARAADGALDVATHAFATALLAAANNDASSELYKRYFSEPHEDIIALGLDSQVPLVTLLVSELEGETNEGLKSHQGALRDALRLANGALANRSDALADLGRHEARVEAWHETAKAVRGSIRNALGRVAAERKLASHWVESFFPG